MSKRYFPQDYGERKKAKLDLSITDHNFPMSQNPPSKGPQFTTNSWDDDEDDQMLLMASQVCENACNDSQLPNYSMFLPPSSTSSQVPQPSTSRHTFKTPAALPQQLKDNFNRISSPLPGIASKLSTNNRDISENATSNNKIYKRQDSETIYKQLLQLEEENIKLKSENGKLIEKCVTKEGEASILRTQLKNVQVSVDNARLDKMKVQEKLQTEWMEKLNAANNQMHDLRTQLDFKNLEIINIKERCKKLESNKLNLTHVTISNNVSSKKVKMVSDAVQTDTKMHFLKLSKTVPKAKSKLSQLLPYILQPTVKKPSILEYNEKLRRCTDSVGKCQVFSTFHRVPSMQIMKDDARKININSVYEDLSSIAVGEGSEKNYFKVFNTIKLVLEEAQKQLVIISHRVTKAFQKEMDENYLQSSCTYTHVDKEHLLYSNELYKDEQDIQTRRMAAILAYLLETTTGAREFNNYERRDTTEKQIRIFELIQNICLFIDKCSSGVLYSGLLLSIVHTLPHLHTDRQTIVDIVKTVIKSKPLSFVSCELLRVISEITSWNELKISLCAEKTDQGNEDCTLQMLYKQVKSCLKCIERDTMVEDCLNVTRSFLVLFCTLYSDGIGLGNDKSKCSCNVVLLQVCMFALRMCAVMLTHTNDASSSTCSSLLSMSRCGVLAASGGGARDDDVTSLLRHHEGHLIQFCDILHDYQHSEIYSNMLSELLVPIQSYIPTSYHKTPWVDSFSNITLSD